MEYSVEEFFKKGFNHECPNLRKKSKGFLKGYTYSCSGNKEELDPKYVQSVCEFQHCNRIEISNNVFKPNSYSIKYDECNVFISKGIVN